MRSLHSLDEKEAISFLISFFLINFFSFFLRPVFLTNYLIYTIEYNKREGFGETLLQRFNSFPHHFLTHLSLLRPQQLFSRCMNQIFARNIYMYGQGSKNRVKYFVFYIYIYTAVTFAGLEMFSYIYIYGNLHGFQMFHDNSSLKNKPQQQQYSYVFFICLISYA